MIRSISLVLLAGCNWLSQADLAAQLDRDDDGLTLEDGDCDDSDPSVRGATEWFDDADGDGFGEPSSRHDACVPDADDVAIAGDCDDTRPERHPGVTDICNFADDDCDGDLDEDDPPIDAWTDEDGDGHGDPATQIAICGDPGEQVLLGDDCNDAQPAIRPSAAEICNGLDDDCDGLVDDADDAVDPTTLSLWAPDADNDGYVGSNAVEVLVSSCQAPPGFIAASSDSELDCNDADDTVSPLAVELCSDGIDNDCDGTTDLAGVDGTDYYPDNDSDGWPDSFTTSSRCNDGDALFVSVTGFDPDTDPVDCDPTDPTIRPGAVEIFYDTIDQDCVPGNDGDADGDGFITPLFGGDDCDDSNAGVNPEATEVLYNGVDENCDGRDDDADADGYGIEVDCDDTDPTVNPGEDEIWYDGIDQDCDGNDDDQDLDGFTQNAAGTGDDCNDTSAIVFPGAGEIPLDGIDQDCNGADTILCFLDDDGDGSGGASTLSPDGDCIAPLRFTGGDCNDNDAQVHPGAVELCDDIDQNCDGTADGERVSGFRPDGTGVALKPGLLDLPGPHDMNEFSEIAFCGEGPWEIDSMVTDAPLHLYPVNRFGRPSIVVLRDEYLLHATDEVVLESIDLLGAGRTATDPTALMTGGGTIDDVVITDLSGVQAIAVDGPSQWNRVVLDGGAYEQEGLLFSNANHSLSAMTLQDTVGDVMRVDPSVTVSMFSSTVSDNDGSCVIDGQLVVEAVDFTGNLQTPVVVDGFTSITASFFIDNEGAEGGAISVSGAANLREVIVTGNEASTDGGGIFVDTGATLVFELGDAFNNSTDGNGGLLYSRGLVSMVSVSLSENMARRDGGHAYNEGLLDMADVTIQSGNATNGGAVYSTDNAVLRVSDVTVLNNTARSNGGAIFGPVFGDDTEFTSNSAGGSGGAIYGPDTDLTNSQIRNNMAEFSGGGVFGPGRLDDAVVQLNSAGRSGGGWFLGGLNSSSGFASGTLFTMNTAGTNGGGVYANNASRFTDSSLVGNQAVDGGGAVFTGGVEHVWSGSLPGRATFEANTATQFGGGVSIFDALLETTSVTYDQNSASMGGGQYGFESEVVEHGPVYTSNSGTSGGGGIAVTFDATYEGFEPELTGNTASRGSGVFVGDDFADFYAMDLITSDSLYSDGVEYSVVGFTLDTRCASGQPCMCDLSICPVL